MSINDINRGKALCKVVKDIIKDKYVCHIGCSNGSVTREFSKHARKILGIEIEDIAKEAKQKKYECDTTIVQADAVEYLRENEEIKPDVFYFWANYGPWPGGMQWWLERIIELRGETNPIVFCAVSLHPDTGGVPKTGEHPQLKSAKFIKEIYGGLITTYEFQDSKKNNIPTSLLILQLDGHEINKQWAIPITDTVVAAGKYGDSFLMVSSTDPTLNLSPQEEERANEERRNIMNEMYRHKDVDAETLRLKRMQKLL